jgi:hypothetical protein
MLSNKLQGKPDGPAGPQIDDPLALHETPTTNRDLWLGARVGGGMFDDGNTAARAGFALGFAARYRTSEATFLAARADWSRRGGAAMTGTIDTLGASAGAGITVLDHESLALALIGQLRGDLRLTDTRDASPVNRAGLSVAAGAELALPSTPFTLGLRFEQGITEIVPGARDRAVLAEVGIDWR